jgi:RNA polymerase sigma factor (TIGR02999 family)
VTRLLQAWRQGDPEALDNLMPIVYDDLHQMAERHFRRERPGHTLQPTAIVNEVYLRLVGTESGTWENRAHFFAAAARTMRHILVDHARTRQAKKRGGQGTAYLLDTTGLVEPRAVDLIAVDDGLEELTKLDAEQGRVVELRFFAGLTEAEIAKVLGISEASVYRKWLSAKAFLHRKLAGGDR